MLCKSNTSNNNNSKMLNLSNVQNYFAQLNPIAIKIAHDINETKLAYGQFWCQLNANEQSDIINETLIKPELTLRYFCNFSTSTSLYTLYTATTTQGNDSTTSAGTAENNTESCQLLVKKGEKPAVRDELFTNSSVSRNTAAEASPPQQSSQHNYAFDGRNLRTFRLQKIALKIVHDDLGGAYRDEHSQPFSYQTKSQINLQLFDVPPETPPGGNTSAGGGRTGLLLAPANSTIQSLSSVTTNKPCVLTAFYRDAASISQHHPNDAVNALNDDDDHMALLDGEKSNINFYAKLTTTIKTKNATEKKAYKKLHPPLPQQKQRYNGRNTSFTTSGSVDAEESNTYDHGGDANGFIGQNDDASYGGGSINEDKTVSVEDEEQVKLLDNDDSGQLRAKGFDFLNNW